CEHIRNGTLWLAVDAEEMAAVHQKHAYHQARGVATEVIDGRGVANAEPNLRPGFAGALRVPGDSVIYPPCAARRLIEQAQQHGAALDLVADVAGFDGTTIRLANGGQMAAGSIVHATGAWTRHLFPELPIRPRKGHLVITDRYPGFVRHQLVELGYLKSAHGG